MPRYSIGTWDTDLQAFTPQIGLSVPSFNITIHELRQAMRELVAMGYSCHRYKDGDSDPCVFIERTDGKSEAEIMKGWR